MKKLAMALVPFLMIACGEPPDENGDGVADGIRDPNNVSVVVPSTPKGTVSGQVLTTQQRPLATANVALTFGSSTAPRTATTDESGNFFFQDVPGGAQVLLTVSKEGYATMRASATVPNSAGNVPINNGNVSFGPVLLSETNASVTFMLIGPTGRPAQGAKATLEVAKAGALLFGSAEWNSSTVVIESIADANGVVTFANVPNPADIDRLDGEYTLVVSAYDENGDGTLEANGIVRTYTGQALLTGANAKPLELPFAFELDPDADGAFGVVYTNIAALKGGPILPQYNMIKPGENIYIVFNQPVQTSSVIVGLTDEYGGQSIIPGKAVTSGGTVLTVTPPALQPGKEYNLYVRAVSTRNGALFSTSPAVAFFCGDPALPQPIRIEASVRFYDLNAPSGNNQLDSGEYVVVTFNQVMNRFGTKAYAFFKEDLSPTTATLVTGEWKDSDRSIVGFDLEELEPQAFGTISGIHADPRPVFPIAGSGFTSRFYFRYGNGTTTYKSFSAGTGSTIPLVFAFGLLNNPAFDTYESAWGVPQLENLEVNATLIAIPPPTTP
ncbi:MAG: carboxypeptidase regulatory-like domain-containing protein [Myxococcaceae bacterium]|nr:carboxypeptidase regulatory-like domain-containing protein [Myxococcaceae bacterium]